MEEVINKAIIPAGGRGTRFKPITNYLPKEMIPLVDRPQLQYALEDAVAAGYRPCKICKP